jgi:hypothetical protein
MTTLPKSDGIGQPTARCKRRFLLIIPGATDRTGFGIATEEWGRSASQAAIADSPRLDYGLRPPEPPLGCHGRPSGHPLDSQMRAASSPRNSARKGVARSRTSMNWLQGTDPSASAPAPSSAHYDHPCNQLSERFTEPTQVSLCSVVRGGHRHGLLRAPSE